ncbi:phage portal protein [Mycobacterium timonense]|uniref:Phage portal protein n=1 Tax=Mycobacterium timonense TaxID=701043 RepID=A0A7I9YZY1_9MYCO|nr:phage portal protein [Mycobacterium timonense]GFG94280.1 hypothetical protein MTIM_01590 [Mycobacterium timonense]
MDTDLLVDLLHTLDAPQWRYKHLESYYTGTQPLSYLSPEARVALGDRFARMVSNLPRLAVTSLAERLRITGFAGVDVWPDWLRLDLDQLSAVAMREALLFGQSFVIAWSDAVGRPLATVESPKQVAVITDPGTRAVTSAVKRWRTQATTEAVVYLPDQIIRLRADTPGAATSGFNVIDTLDNPIGVVPVVPVRNTDLISVYHPNANGVTDVGHSEIADLMPLVDGLAKLLTDMMVTSEYVGRPRRWATGVELVERPVIDSDGNPVVDEDNNPVVETVSPFPEGDRLMTAESEQAKFGQLEAANLDGYQNAVAVIMQQISAVSALPAHMLGITTALPPSADAIRAAEAAITARAEQRQQTFGRAWEAVARLIVAVRDGVDPAGVHVRVQWAAADTSSVAAEADATVKLFQAGLLPASYALQKLGYSADEIEAIRAARTADATNHTNQPVNGPQNANQGRESED